MSEIRHSRRIICGGAKGSFCLFAAGSVPRFTFPVYITSHPTPSVAVALSPLFPCTYIPPLASLKMWAVKICLVSSAPYIIKSWNQASLVTMVLHKLLPGYVTIYAADPHTFLCTLPKSHPACVET
ncbi:hypothetical protein BDN67DRAFT_1017075 [Paxillus ammoniavirescens]|nr:hypothetical protein BDN67DRAFT_1017075 [Paxillus ammoniavirescens]